LWHKDSAFLSKRQAFACFLILIVVGKVLLEDIIGYKPLLSVLSDGMSEQIPFFVVQAFILTPKTVSV